MWIRDKHLDCWIGFRNKNKTLEIKVIRKVLEISIDLNTFTLYHVIWNSNYEIQSEEKNRNHDH